nr:reverse transcriptase domain-containing protein [Tanacetum cinerariifolium]
MHQEKLQQEKLKAVKARINFEEVSQHFESGTPSRRRDLRKRLRSKCIRSLFESPKPRRDRSESPRKRSPERETVFKRLEKGVFHSLRDKEKSMFAYSDDSRHQSYHSSHRDNKSYYQSSHSKRTKPASKKHHSRKASSRRMEVLSESEDNAGGHWKPSKDQALRMMICLSHRHARKQTLSLLESATSNYQKVSDAKEDFMQRFKVESGYVNEAPECMGIFRFMHGITNPELIKRLHDNILKSVDEMMRATTTFLKEEVAASNQARKKTLPARKQ